MEETTILTYNEIIENGKWDFFQKIKKQEIIDETIGETTINFIENPKTGGRFWIYDKNDNSNPLGWLCLHNGKLYIVNNNTENITLLNTNTLEDLDKLKETYNIYYIDKETPDKLQPVSIEDENNIQTDKGVVLSFDKIDPKNPNSELYLWGIYNGEFKEVTKEITNPETKEKTTKTRKLLTGYVNAFYQNGKIFYKGEIVGGFFHGLGTCYYSNGNKYIGEWKNGNKDGQGIYYYNNDDKYVGEWKDGNKDGQGIYYRNNKDKYVGKWKNGNMHGKGVYYYHNGDKYIGEWKDDNMHGQGIYYGKIIIQQGEFRNDSPYSISAYLREDPTGETIEELNNEQIEEKNKIYTLERDKTNSDIRTLIFYTTNSKIGLNRDIQIHIDENNIATLQTIDGEPTKLTKEEINKIKKFFNNIPIEQLKCFNPYLATLYYTTIMNKEEYKDTNILIPDFYKYKYKTDKEVEQTKNLINQISQEKTKGKYIVPCGWLRNKHQVNLIIDFANKICEIVNTGANVDQNVIDRLQQELRSYFKEDNWVVYENNIVRQSDGNCVIASNIVATEKIAIEDKVKEYNKKNEELIKADIKLKENIQQQLQETLNTIINKNKNNKDTQQTITVEELEKQIKSFVAKYNNKIENLVIQEILYQDLRNEINKLKKERQGQIITEELLEKELLQKQSIEDRIKNIKQDKERLKIEKENFVRYNLISKERLFNECGNQFDRELSEIIMNERRTIRVM